MDRRPGRLPLIRASGGDVTYEFTPLGGELARGVFAPPPRTRLIVRCDATGGVFMRIVTYRAKR